MYSTLPQLERSQRRRHSPQSWWVSPTSGWRPLPAGSAIFRYIHRNRCTRHCYRIINKWNHRLRDADHSPLDLQSWDINRNRCTRHCYRIINKWNGMQLSSLIIWLYVFNFKSSILESVTQLHTVYNQVTNINSLNTVVVISGIINLVIIGDNIQQFWIRKILNRLSKAEIVIFQTKLNL